jgi:hypothetical protein
MASKQMLAVLATIVVAFLPVSASQTVHPVGDARGWTLGFNYTTWSEGNQFKVSDSLRKRKALNQFHLSFFARKSNSFMQGV